MKKEIYISESMGESRIAIIEDSTLVEVYVEKQDHQRMVGNIYKGQVENVLPGMQAAFVDIGYDINAFLPFSEIENSAYLSEIDDRDDNSSKNKKIIKNLEEETIVMSMSILKQDKKYLSKLLRKHLRAKVLV